MKTVIIHGQSHAGSTCMVARKILQNAGQQGCNHRGKFWFSMMGFAQKHFPPMEPDYGYWEQQGWHRGGRPWK